MKRLIFAIFAIAILSFPLSALAESDSYISGGGGVNAGLSVYHGVGFLDVGGGFGGGGWTESWSGGTDVGGGMELEGGAFAFGNGGAYLSGGGSFDAGAGEYYGNTYAYSDASAYAYTATWGNAVGSLGVWSGAGSDAHTH